jgi:hypothetical protein
MLSWPNLKWYVDSKEYYRKISRPTLSSIWISSDDRVWCHDLIWGALWIGRDSEIIFLWPNLKCNVDWKISFWKLSRPIWSTMWIRSGDRGWCHDLICGHMRVWTDDTGCCLDQIYIAHCIGKDVRESFPDNFEVLCGL